jgi:6-phosphogluconolactonase (cycloisomerase 2 family)
MKSALYQRQLVSFVCSLLLLVAAVGCGGSSSSSNTGSNSSGTNSGSTGATSGSSNPGNTGGSGGNTGGSASSSTGPTYVYAPIYADQGGVEGFSQDTAGNLKPVPGSPVTPQAFGATGALAAYNGNVYIGSYPDTTGHTVLIQYKANSSDGSLTQVGSKPALASGQGDTGLRKLWVNSKHNVMYGVYQWTVVTYALASDGTPSIITSTAPSTDSVTGFDFMPNGPYAYAAIQNGNPKTGFQTPQIMLLTMVSDGSVTTTRSVATLNQNFSGDLKIDPSGKYVVAQDGFNDNEIRVFAIQSDGSLTEVPGSPFAAGTQYSSFLAFDPSGKFLYSLSQSPAQPQPENLQVYSFDPSSGKLAQVQNIAEPNEQNALGLTVDGNFVYITNTQGGTQSTITVYNADPNTGMLTQSTVNTVPRPVGQTEVLHF